MSFQALPQSRRKAILDTVVYYLRDRPRDCGLYVTVDELTTNLPISEGAAVGAMTHLESDGPYRVRRSDVGGEIRWMVSGKLS